MNITVIIPVHKYDETVKKYLEIALKSISVQDKIGDDLPEVILISPKGIDFNDLDTMGVSINYLVNEGDTDFQSQVNCAVDNIKTDYFSILELDDEYSNTYFYRAIQHIERLEDVDLFLPILVEVNEEGKGIKFTNETVWSRQFVGENGTVGYLNLNALQQYTDFKISGGLFKKDSFVSVGKLKKNIKMTFVYELLLRMLNNGDKIYTIPKIGYKHLLERKDALFTKYNNKEDSEYIDLNERKFWFNVAKKESNFFSDREIDTSILTE